MISTGKSTRFVRVPTTRVKDVNQPNAFVPPKSLNTKMIKPAIRTRDVYMILIPVCLIV
jgi:hypothetical protein